MICFINCYRPPGQKLDQKYVFRDRKALDKSQISHHSGILVTWLLKAKEPCASQGSLTFSEDTAELPFIHPVQQLICLKVT